MLRACCFSFWFSSRTLWVLEGSCPKGRDVSSLAKPAQVVTRGTTRSKRINRGCCHFWEAGPQLGLLVEKKGLL